MSDETTLLPCPFCGGEAHTLNQAPKGTGYSVGCNDDECRGFIALSWIYKTEAEAITAWNTRHVETCKNMREKFGYKRLFVCSECGVTFDPDCEINYCPWCGRKVVNNAD